MTTSPSGPAGRLRIAGLSARRPTRFDLQPDEAARAALAAELGLLSLGALRFRGEVRPAGGQDWLLEARLTAEAGQACVVTLTPVATTVDTEVVRRYVHDLPPPAADEAEMPEDDAVEPLPEVIDLEAVMAEALLLALPDYPRAEGAGIEGGTGDGDAPPPGTTRPFAGLGALMKKDGEDG